MKIQLYKIVAAVECLTEIQKNNEIPFALAWKIADVIEPLEKHFKRFQDEKDKIVKNLGSPDKKNAAVYLIKPENTEKFEKSIKELGEITIQLSAPKKLNKKELFESDIKINGRVSVASLKDFINV